MSEMQQPEPEQFVTRVCELPVVNDTISQLSSVYFGIKKSNRLIRFTFETAEMGVQTVAMPTVTMVVTKIGKPITTLNSLACDQLDKLEHDYPIITKPSVEVLNETKQMCGNAVKPIVDRVSAVKQYGIDKVTYAKTYTTETIGTVKAFGIDKFSMVTDVGSHQMVRVLGAPVCNEVVKNVDAILGAADVFVDKWLPEGPVDAGEDETKPTVTVDQSVKDHVLVIGKAASIGNKVRRRVYARLAGRLTDLHTRTKETVDRLNVHLNLIEYSRSARDKARYIWTEINKTDEELAKELTDDDNEPKIFSNATFERKTIATIRHLSGKLRTLMTSVGVPPEQLPTILKTQLERAQELAQNLANSVPTDQGLPAYAIANLRNYSSLLVQTTAWIADWARKAPLVGQFVPAAVVNETKDDKNDPSTELLSAESFTRDQQDGGEKDDSDDVE
jgi:hypothetical protein